jgi:sensor c-di-GMP phosphodiesterase-like protein
MYAINLSVSDLKDRDFIPFLLGQIESTCCSPRLIEFELTESMLIDSDPQIQETLEGIRSLGFQIAIDDFGTGYSSLSSLHNIHVQHLKIDQSFVRVIEDGADPDSFPVLNAIISMGASLGLEITAEGVETRYQADYLREKGCHTAQGWLYSRGIPLEQFIDFVNRRS